MGCFTKGHFTRETESPWPLHFKHSHWWKRRSRSKFAPHLIALRGQRRMWMQDGCEVYMDSYVASNGSCFMVTFQKPPLGGWPNTKLRDHGTLHAHNLWFILFYHMWGSKWLQTWFEFANPLAPSTCSVSTLFASQHKTHTKDDATN
jgi:hypothetical protein